MMERFFNLRKSKWLLFMLFALLTGVSPVTATELTLYSGDGTVTNQYVPIYGYYGDTNSMNGEFIIPANQLTALATGSITDLKFYFDGTNSQSGSWSSTFQVYLNEVDVTTYSSSATIGSIGATVVYENTLALDRTNNELTIHFSKEYEYQGGNLLIGIKVTNGTGAYPKVYFYGESQDKYTSYQAAGGAGRQSFLPKTTITYTAGNGVSKPKNVVAGTIEKNSVTIGWDNADGINSWEVSYRESDGDPSEGTIKTATENSIVLSGLTAETTYYVYVRAKKGGDYSGWTTALAVTPTAAVDLTIFDETDTNGTLPVYGTSSYNTKTYTQFIVPSSQLSSIKNGQIKKLTFYSSDASKTLKSYSVYVTETDASEFTSNDASTMSGTVVYNGVLTISDNKMVITFAEPFDYTGKNLQIGFSQNTKEYSVASIWYGKNQSTNVGIRTYGGEYNAYIQFLPKTTINYVPYEAPTIPSLQVTDPNSQVFAETPASYDFGLTETAETRNFTIQNIGAGSLTVKSISATGGYLLKIGDTEASSSIGSTAIGTSTDTPVTLQVVQAAGTSEGVITITTDVDGNDEDEIFVINVSGIVRDTDKEYQNGFTSLPSGWSVDGSWSNSATNGAYTTAWYIVPMENNTITRLKTPLLTIASGEKFVVEAKGYSTSNTEYQHLQLQYSADGTNWTNLGDELALDPSNWKMFTVTLPNTIEAGNYYIGLLASQADIRMYYGGEVVSGPKFAISTDGSEQNFGDVEPNAVATKLFTITNSGNEALTVTATNAADFYVKKAINFTDSKTWGTVYLYAWTGEGADKVEYFGAWPGEKQTKTATNDYGQDTYVLSIPVGAKIILHNNAGTQSQNITLDYTQTGLYLGESNEALYWGDADESVFNAAGNIVVAANGGTTTFAVGMVTSKTVGDKSGNVVLGYTDINGAGSFTIPCKGYVIDHSKLYVTFSGSEWPAEIMQHGDNWSVSDGTAGQSSQQTLSSLVLTPVTVVDGKDLKFKVTRYGSVSNNPRDMYLRYTTDGGVTWIEYNWGTSTSLKEQITSNLDEFTVTGIPAGTAVFDFNGKYIKLDDIIADYAVTTGPLIAMTEGGTAIVNNSTKDFGNLNPNEQGEITYTLTNNGNAAYEATITGTDVYVYPTSVNIPAGGSATVSVYMPYNNGKVAGSMTITSESWVGDITLNYTATLLDPTDFVQDFSGNAKPAGWYSDGWSYTGGVASVNSGVEKPMITEKIGAEAGKNTLTFDAWTTGENQTLNVYTSTDRKNWTLLGEAIALTSESTTYTRNLTNDDQYIKFGGAVAKVDNIKGVKKLDAPAHDLYLVSATLPTADITPIDTYTATVKVASLRADETVTAELFFGDDKVGELTDLVINNGATVELKPTATGIAAGTYQVYAKVYNDNVSVETEKVSVTVADKTELSLTGFTAVTTAVQADDNNQFTANFNVTVKNTGSTAFTADQISVSVTDKDNNDLETATWTPGETIYLKAGNYTADNANLAIYRWNEGEANSSEWALFTAGDNGIYTASLNGKNDFIICRTNPAVDISEMAFAEGKVWTQSYNLTTASGVVFENNGYENNKLKLAQSNNFIAGMSATIKVTVTADAGNGGEFQFNAKENVSDVYWYSDLGYLQSVNVTAAPTIVLNENNSAEIATGTNRKVRLNHSFVAGWNTICVPFAISDLSVFGTDAVAYSFDGYDTTTKELTFNKATTLNAGKPYVIYVPAAITEALEFTGVTIETANTTAGESTSNSLTFQGTYAPVTFSEIAGDQWGLTAAGKIAKASATATMKGFRGYFTGVDLSNARMVFLGDESTGIRTITVDGNAVEGTYNLQGQKVETIKKGGLYIINGKKVVMK